jgi:aryl-alcohol dehydrogenase-like predicted oxidoreductase
VPASALALAWVLRQPQVDAAIIGPRKASHLADALAALTVSLSDADLRTLTALFA